MYANGHGSVEIMQYLNSNNYLSPTGYRKTGIVRDKNKTNYNWNEVTLCNMLKNEVYIGNTVQNKKSVISYKIKKTRTVEKENQIRVDNTHEPIINKDIFNKVQCIIEKRGANATLKHDYLLRGLLYCYHCKRKLQIVLKNNSQKSKKSYPYITCSGHKERGCYPLNINYNKFEEYILYIVRSIIKTYSNKENLCGIYNKYKNKTLDIRKELIIKLEQTNKEINCINNNLDKMYMDKLNGIISEEDYIRIYQKLIFDRTKLNIQKKEIEKNLNLAEKTLTNKESIQKRQELEKLIDDFLKLEQIDKIYLYLLINKIEIDKDKKIYIYFNFSKLNNIDKNSEKYIKIENLIYNKQNEKVV